MSNEPSDRSDAAPDPIDATLRAELDHAQANLARLEAEYAELLADPGVILEDRDSTRRLLEAARVTAAAATRAMGCRGAQGFWFNEAVDGVTAGQLLGHALPVRSAALERDAAPLD